MRGGWCRSRPRSRGGCWAGSGGRRGTAYAAPMIRTATAADVPAIHAMVRELADYEKALHEANATEEQLREALFGERPAAFAHIAESEEDGEVVGFALWFLNFSTWRGVHGIYLEDLYVRPDRRGGGHGKALLGELARICVERGYERLEWSVLDWNAPSIAFYESLGARPQDEWTVYRLTDGALAELGGR
ncbi:GNAT family N-acetyltransferase [Streptomyces sp. NBC_00341]|nr:GNAT family N-acetyltransferase [Streptomyces sp. NBC_00341]